MTKGTMNCHITVFLAREGEILQVEKCFVLPRNLVVACAEGTDHNDLLCDTVHGYFSRVVPEWEIVDVVWPDAVIQMGVASMS